MEKSRRGGASRFKRHTTSLDGGRGEVKFSEKISKKERVRKLSVVGKLGSINRDSEMGCVGFDVEDELLRNTPSVIKRSKLPRKLVDDCNRVDHASVPRKLRSAMKKRNRDSISPPFPEAKKRNHAINGTELPKKNGPQGDSEGSRRRAIVGSITKDEEEVVETLSALAILFPSSDKTNKATANGEISNAKSSTSPEGDDSKPAFEGHPVSEKEAKANCPSITIRAANPSSDLEGSARATEEAKSLNRPLDGKRSHIEVEDSEFEMNLQTISLPFESEHKRPSCNTIGSSVPSEPCPGTGSKQQPSCDKTSAGGTKAEIALEADVAVRTRDGLEQTIKERKYNGSALWPDLALTGSHGTETPGPSLQSSAAKLPAWLRNTAFATLPASVDNIGLTEKNSRVLSDRKKSWKTCSAHVYISRLTKVLQDAERKEGLPMQATQLMPDERSNQGVLTAINSLNVDRKGLSGTVSADGIIDSAVENRDKVTSAILLHKRLLQDEQHTSTTSGLCTLQKQSLDFLSLWSGGGGVEATNRSMGYGWKPPTQSHGPFLQSLAQNHIAVPYSPQNHYSSTPFTDHLSAVTAQQQAQVLVPPYHGSPFWGTLRPVTMSMSSPKQQQQQQQHHQRIWAAQLAAQYRPGHVAAPHIPNWQNGRQDPSSMFQYAQAILPPPCSSHEALGPKYGPMSQQQQQLIAITSSLPKRQHHNLHAGYGGGLQPDGAPSLQLLCNEPL